MHRYVYAALVAVGVPYITNASIVISEVAWMGSNDNANAEWIELYNDGPAQDLSGWSLATTDGQPAIALSGTISANGYALLERTGDDTIPSVTAFLVYTGAMGNTGEVLELRNESGVLVDKVDGSGDWAIGGNNETKDTLQRSGNPPTGSFITAPATPQGGGGVPSDNNANDDESENTDTNTSGTVAGANTSRSGSGGNIIYGTARSSGETTIHLDPALVLELPGERTVTVGVPTTYTARAFKESGKETTAVAVQWNFGDGSVQTGLEVTHAYAYPGTYIVTIEGNRTGFLREITARSRMTVRVLEPELTIAHATRDYIEIKNVSGEEVDVSGYVLTAGGMTFRLPAGTFLVSKGSVRFTRSITGLDGSQSVTLFHPTGAVLASTGVAVPKGVMRTSQNYTAPSPGKQPKEEFATVPVVEASSTSSIPDTLATPAYTSGGSEEKNEGELAWWLAALAAVIGITVAVIILARREEAEIVAGFEIESDE